MFLPLKFQSKYGSSNELLMLISIGGKNWQIGGKKYIGEGSGGRLRPCHGFAAILSITFMNSN
jgi:hypothetical protein